MVVNVDLVESLDRADGDLSHPGDPAQQVVMDAVDEMAVENVYVPRFAGFTSSAGDGDCKPEEDECTFTVTFEFANSAYFPGNTPPPVAQVFALNAFTEAQVDNSGQFKKAKACDDLNPTEPKPAVLSGGRRKNSVEEAFEAGLTAEKFDYKDSEPKEDLEIPPREFSLRLFTEEQVSTCGFGGYLIQWVDHETWPAVLCTQDEVYRIKCDETVLRYP